MPGLSLHVMDVAHGVVGSGMRVEVWAMVGPGVPRSVAAGTIGRDGGLSDPALAQTLAAGPYRATFHVGAYYAARGIAAETYPFLDVVHFDFGVADPAQHYHLPFKCTPWGFSCFRGGA